jgi:NMD protein affecting ribosome stability and mRNA decay
MTLEQLVEAYGLEWQAFKDALEEMDKEAFLELIERAKRHAEAGTKIESPNLFESVVMSILVEHQRELQQLQEILLPNQTKTCPRCSRTASIEDFFKGENVNDGGSSLCSHCKEALNFTTY